MPKPIMNAAGSGMHIHQSLFMGEENIFYSEKDKYNLSKLAYNFIAGQIKHIKAVSAVTCPSVNSFKRLVSGYEAPIYISWGRTNRSTLIRLPDWSKKSKSSARFELRCPDVSANPYLAFSAVLMSGMDGINNNLKPPKPVEENLYKIDPDILEKNHIDILPGSLYEAIEEFKKSRLMEETFGKRLFDKYIETKINEWNRFKVQVTKWELNQYFDQ